MPYGIGGEALRLQIEAVLGSLDHRLRCRNLIVRPRRRRLGITITAFSMSMS